MDDEFLSDCGENSVFFDFIALLILNEIGGKFVMVICIIIVLIIIYLINKTLG